MATLVSIEAYSGTLRRYEIGETVARLTHFWSLGRPATFLREVIDSFRTNPDASLSVEPPPRPTNPPAGAGTATLPKAA